MSDRNDSLLKILDEIDKIILDGESKPTTKIEYAIDRLTGTLYPMEVEIEEECPVIKEARKKW